MKDETGFEYFSMLIRDCRIRRRYDWRLILPWLMLFAVMIAIFTVHWELKCQNTGDGALRCSVGLPIRLEHRADQRSEMPDRGSGISHAIPVFYEPIVAT